MNDRERTGEVILPRRDYPLLESEQAMKRVLHLIETNLGGQEISVLNLSRIKVPSGDETDFKVETASGVERHSTLTGVITAFRPARAYWARPYGVGRKGPPDCSSKDGFIGTGNPGGECPKCPFARFGSAKSSDGGGAAGQACKDLRQMLILLPGQLLPHMLSIPPTSLGNFTKYSLNLISAGEEYWTVTTKITLEPATSQGGVAYARVRFTLHDTLKEPQTAILEPYHERMYGLLTPMEVDATAYEITGGDESQPSGDDVPF